jgi:hypothetical protein
VVTRFAVACAVMSAGCQIVSGVNDLEIRASSGPDWSCLAARKPPPPQELVSYSGVVRRLGNNQPVLDAIARLCHPDDEPCAEPVLPPVVARDGLLEFEVAGSFNGYIELTSAALMPGLVELSRGIGQMRALPEFRMVEPETMQLFAAKMMAEIEPGLGHALFWVEDCQGARAPGVSVEVQLAAPAELPETSRAYYVIDTRLPSTAVHETDASGAGGFINLPTTFITFSAFRAADHAHISTFSARIRAGEVTFFIVEPD